MPENPEAIQMAREALADLTTRISDITGETTELAVEHFKAELKGFGDDAAFKRAARLAIGYGIIGPRLVVMCAQSSGIEFRTVLEELGRWIAAMEL
jgi:hypothetical protein